MSEQQVFVLAIFDRQGESVSCFRSRDGAEKALFQYVLNQWFLHRNDSIPSDPEEAAEKFFESNPDSMYTLQPCEIEE